MTSAHEERLLAVVNELANQALGYDWFEIRERIDKWTKANPAKAKELVHYVRYLMEAWDHA
ncbi:MAG: hypothetical protein ACYDBQ_03485 [Thermoplasmatota archaeon]